ncbi:MATE family efflux transporter [Paracoccaceae bacterium]|nr:MATE family efflux transporter [Paracoccaceae bacterium]
MMLSQIFTKTDKRVLKLAYPIILANVSIPLLGLTDTAVIGHLGNLNALAGISMGAVLMGSIYWFFGFLRMGVTGLVAQARGSKQNVEVSSILLRGLIIAGIGGIGLIAIHFWLFSTIFYFLGGDVGAEKLAMEYMSIRVLAAPFAISMFVFVGWLFGMGKTIHSLCLLVAVNFLNILLDIIFVNSLYLGISGVAYATIISEFFGFASGIYLCREFLLNKERIKRRTIFLSSKWRSFISLNINIVIRSTLLQSVFLSYLIFGTLFGSDTLAANHILLQIIYLSAYALDGVAFSSEILVGEAIGQRRNHLFKKVVNSALKIGFIFSSVIGVSLYFLGVLVVDLMTSIEAVRLICYEFIIWISIMPIVSVFSYVYDGIFLGAARGKEIRIAMVQSSSIFFICVMALVPLMANIGLWTSILVFNAVRALTLWIKLERIEESFSSD